MSGSRNGGRRTEAVSGRSLGPEGCPVLSSFWSTPKHAIPNLSRQRIYLLLLSGPPPCPRMFNLGQRNRAAPSNSTGRAPSNSEQLATPQPNTGQDLDCQTPGLPVWLAGFSPPISLFQISGQPQVRHSKPGGQLKHRSPCPHPYP